METNHPPPDHVPSPSRQAPLRSDAGGASIRPGESGTAPAADALAPPDGASAPQDGADSDSDAYGEAYGVNLDGAEPADRYGRAVYRAGRRVVDLSRKHRAARDVLRTAGQALTDERERMANAQRVEAATALESAGITLEAMPGLADAIAAARAGGDLSGLAKLLGVDQRPVARHEPR